MIKRPDYINAIVPFIGTPLVKILAGVRRCGKSTILAMLADMLKAEGIPDDHIIERRYNEIGYDGITAKDMSSDLRAAISGKSKCFLLLDEVQETDGWEKVINDLLESTDCDIYVTGSNSKLMSAEISTYLTGRYVLIPVYTLSLREGMTEQYDLRCQKKFAYGITGGAGVEFSRPKVGHFTLEARYNFGLSDIFNNSKRDTPFVLDKEGQLYRDSCIHIISELLKMNADNRAKVIADSTHYEEASLRIKETRDYAEKRYRDLERYVFIDGQTPFLDILADFDQYWSKTKADLRAQYGFKELTTEIDEVPKEDIHAGEGSESFAYFSSKSENALLVILCFMQIFFLALSWLVVFIILRLLCHFTRLKKYVPKNKRTIISILIGTIAYFIMFAFGWGGDEYMQLGVKHVNTFLWLLIAITGSLLLRVKPEQFREGFLLYSATFMIVMVIIACRISFIPDKFMVMLFPPILLLGSLWQLFFCVREHSKVMAVDRNLGWVSLTIYLGAFVCSFFGYTFVALLILVWWYFLQALWLSVVCAIYLLNRFKERWLNKRIDAMRERITYVSGEDRESLLFGATWFYDLIRQVIIPAVVLISMPLCVSLSLSIFDFDDLYVKFYENPFIHLYDKSDIMTLRISVESIVNLLILYYFMRYLSRAIHAIWQYGRYAAFMRKHNRTTIRVNEINLSLGNSIISALIWIGYAAIVIHVWRIPTGSLGLVAGGLSAGIGLAMKDTINNFLYGIQLMGGRLRVGDWIECDGVRGKVSTINYQCVQVETIEGTEMSFLNSSLFGKNFNNLTRNNSYELTIITVGVAYGTEVQQVRDVLVRAMQKMRTKDLYGREIVDPKYGFNVVVGNMSDSAVDINVKQ